VVLKASAPLSPTDENMAGRSDGELKMRLKDDYGVTNVDLVPNAETSGHPTRLFCIGRLQVLASAII
jgi:hypothetical protein